jgi:hypothetical protein
MQEQLKAIGFNENDFELITTGLTGTSGETITEAIKDKRAMIEKFKTMDIGEILNIKGGLPTPLIDLLKDTSFGKTMIKEAKEGFIKKQEDELKEMIALKEDSSLLRAKMINFRKLLIENKVL